MKRVIVVAVVFVVVLVLILAGKPEVSTGTLGGAVGIVPAKGVQPQAPTATPAGPAAADKAVFVFIHIPEAIMPTERGKKYEDPIEAALKKAGVGEVTGSGTGMKKDGGIEYVGVDVDLTDLKKGLAILKAELTRIGAPKGTRLQYTVDEKRIDVAFDE